MIKFFFKKTNSNFLSFQVVSLLVVTNLFLFLITGFKYAEIGNNFSKNNRASALELTKSVSNATPLTGESFFYTLQYRCAGLTEDCLGTVITDPLPAGIEFVAVLGSVHTTSESYDVGTNTVSFTFIDPLISGTTGEVRIEVRFPNGTTPDGTVANNTATISASNAASVSSSASATASAMTRLNYEKSFLNGGTVDGHTTYHLNICNGIDEVDENGSLDFNNITIVDTLPPGSIFIETNLNTGSSSTYDAASHTVTITHPSLAPGECIFPTVSVQYPNPPFSFNEDITNEAFWTFTPVGELTQTVSDAEMITLINPSYEGITTKTLGSPTLFSGESSTYSITAAINGVRVELFKDNGDGIINPAVDTFINFTVTANDGFYLFPNLDDGDYYSIFHKPPTMDTANDVNGNPGYYLFSEIPVGDYFLELDLPSGVNYTSQGATEASDPSDSDFNVSTNRTEVYAVTSGGYDNSWDAGLILSGTEICDNGVDDDSDGLIDEGCPEICNDGIDNDGDGLIDCDDCEDCFASIDCDDNDGDGISDVCDLDDDNDGIPDLEECPSVTVEESLGFESDDNYRGTPPGPGVPVTYKTGVDGASLYMDGSNDATALNFVGWNRPGDLSVDWSEGQYVLTSNERAHAETPAMVLSSPSGGGFGMFSTTAEAISKDISVVIGEKYTVELWLGILPNYYDNNKDIDGTPGIDSDAGQLFRYGGRIEIGTIAGGSVSPGYTSMGDQIDPAGNPSTTVPYYSYDVLTDFPVNYSSADFPSNLPAYDPSEVYTTYPTLDPHWQLIEIEFVATATTATIQLKTNNGNWTAFTVDEFRLVEETGDCDCDGDGVVNSLDLDSDNDGLYDVVEAGHSENDTNQDGIIDNADVNSGNNGLYDGVETAAESGVLNYTLADSETSPDGTLDICELDSDGDGCFDTEEENISDSDTNGVAGTGTPTVDANGLVTTIAYATPSNNTWQNPLVGSCLPEICDDGIDNDGDGLADCLDPDCPCYNPFICESSIYMAYSSGFSQPSTFSTFNTSTVPFTLDIIGNVTYNVNAMGYRNQDNFIYGIELGTNELIRIGADGIGYNLGEIQGLPKPVNPNDSYDSGDVFPDGYLYVHEVQSHAEMYQIDVTTSPPQLVAIHLLNQSIRLSDFAYNIIDDKLYGIGDNGTKYIIDPSNWSVTSIGTNAPSASYGAAYTDDLGRVFIYNNNEGALYMVDFGINGTGTGEMTLIANAPQVYFNDGASCRGTIIIPEICDNSIDDDGDGLIDCDDSDCQLDANPAILNTCDNSNMSGSGVFFLHDANPTVTSESGVVISYHPILADAQNGINNLISPFTSSDGTVYARVERLSTGCYSTALITLDVGTKCVESCVNGIDDDGDGLIDCADPDCPCCGSN